MKSFLRQKTTASHLLFIVLAGILTYANTFHVPFIFDDVQNIAENLLITSLGNFTEPAQIWSNRYVGNLSFAVNYLVHGLDVTGYHVTNLVIHISNAILVYLLVILTFETPFFATRQKDAASLPPIRFLALVIALIFVAHPVQTQAVTYIVQRFTSLATLLYLASLVLYIKARLARMESAQSFAVAPALYLLAVVTTILAMKTKEIAFTLPLAIALYEFMFFRSGVRQRMACLLPLLLTMAVLPLPLLLANRTVGEMAAGMDSMTRAETAMPRTAYLFTQFRVIVTYLRLLFFPVNQNLDYDYPVYTSLFQPEVLSSFLLLMVIITSGGYLLYRSSKTRCEMRLVSFGIFWFFLTLSVESSVIPISDMIYEHRVYLPSAGFFIALIFGVALLLRRYTGLDWAKKNSAVMTLVVVTVITIVGLGFSRNRVWASNVTLWRDVVQKSPGKSRGHNNLGYFLAREGQTDAAIREYQEALRITPDYADAHYNLGLAFVSRWDFDSAIQEFRQALRITPYYTKAHNSLGLALVFRGNPDAAIHEYREALRLNPKNPEVHVNLGAALVYQGEYDAAITEYREALAVAPNNPEAHNGLGNALAGTGALDAAIGAYRQAVQLNPDNAGMKNNLEGAIAKKKMQSEAGK